MFRLMDEILKLSKAIYSCTKWDNHKDQVDIPFKELSKMPSI